MPKRREKAENRPSLRGRIADSVDASREVFLDVTRIIIIGKGEISIENYKGIVEYTAERIILEAKPRRIRLSGSGLEVKSITDEMLYVAGDILAVEFLKEA